MLYRPGLEIYFGCMYAGKTEELEHIFRIARLRGVKTKAFRPAIDGRADRTLAGAVFIERARDCQQYLSSEDRIVGFDEAQFWNELDDLVPTVRTLLEEGDRQIVISSLDLDFRGCPFGRVNELVPFATVVKKLPAVCDHCGADAFRSHRVVADEKLIAIGNKDKYIPLCLSCYRKATAKEFDKRLEM